MAKPQTGVALTLSTSRSEMEEHSADIGFAKWLLAVLVVIAMTGVISDGQTFKVLANFDGTNGSQPFATLLQGTDGKFYGTSLSGGTYATGTVFNITPDGVLTAIHSFCAQNGCPDGREARTAPIQASDGNYYGTTTFGGIDNNYGTVFRVTPTGGRLTTIYRFCTQPNCTDGADVYGSVIQARDGNLYGTTNLGGDVTCYPPYGCGTVFRLTSAGVLTTLHRFHSADGAFPFAGLVQSNDGSFYGTTANGGAYGYGAVFKITPAGKLTTLFSFCAQPPYCIDGSLSYGQLIQATDGNFYGTTETGGTVGFGTVYKITPNGVLTTLHSFAISDGSDPNSALVQGTDGYFYGTTYAGGNTNVGTAFKITGEGTLTTLLNFGSETMGGGYPSGLIQATDGNFYGTTQTGGANNDGTAFSLSVGLGAFVKTQPSSGKAGAKIIILGTDLTGTTSVTFHGTPATFTVVSKSEITTSVPAGATTGKVKVVTPRQILLSNLAFRVKP